LKIEDALILVTGGARNLGLAIAQHLQGLGARVIVADRNADLLAKLPAGIYSEVLDVTQPKMVQAAVRKIVEQYGDIQVLVNNAGRIYNEPMVNLFNAPELMHDYGRFRACIVDNLDSVFIMSSAVVEHMIKRRIKGAIVNVSSISARGNEGQTAYSAAKAATNAMIVTWAKELGRFGIRCNAVAPGFINTDSTQAALTNMKLKLIESDIPLRRLGKSIEVAQAVAALIENEFINGTILPVDGGMII
jgi:3-oxoacyl-[acyl-carrier protein] reductase